MMENEKDVNVDSSPTEEQEVVNQPEPDQQAETPEQQEVAPSPQEVKPESSVDERGVPMQNVYAEMNRKYSETQNQLQQLAELMQKNQGHADNPQANVTDEQLLWCIEDPNATPEAKFYARNELRRRDETKSDEKLKKVFNQYQEEQNVRSQRQQSFNWFASNFPDAVVRDNNGNAVDFNSTHPLVQRIGVYMNDPMARNRGDALMIAAKNASFDLGYASNQGLSKKVKQANAQLKKEQKKTLIAGSGVQPVEIGKSNVLKLADKYKKTQDKDAFKELLRKRGLLNV